MSSRMILPLLVVAALLIGACGAAPPAAAPTTAPTVASTVPPANPTTAPATTVPAVAPATVPVASTAAPAVKPAEPPKPATTAPVSYPITVNDGIGKPVMVTKRPERIVCYAIACADLLFDLGLEPVAVSGTTLYAEALYGERAKAFAIIAAAGSGPNLEDVARAKPDLIIFSPPDAREGLSVIAPAYQVIYTKGIQGTVDDLKAIATLVGREAEAVTAERRFRDRLAAYKATSPSDLRAMVIFPNATGLQVQSRSSIVGAVLGEVTQYPWAPPPSGSGGYVGSFPYSVEQLLADDPDVIFVNDFAFDPKIAKDQGDLRAWLEASPLWRELKAVKTGRVYAIDRRTMDPYSPVRAMRMLDTVMPLLYPQVFPTPLP